MLDDELWDAHTGHFVSVAHAEVMRTMIIGVAQLVTSFVTSEASADAAAGQLTAKSLGECCTAIMSTFHSMPSARTIIEQRKRELLAADPRTRGPAHDPKKAVSFSIVQLLTVMLTESKRIRQHVIKSSEEWKKGKLYNVPAETLTDVTDAVRFRSSDACKKATPAEKKDLRVVLHPWVSGALAARAAPAVRAPLAFGTAAATAAPVRLTPLHASIRALG